MPSGPSGQIILQADRHEALMCDEVPSRARGRARTVNNVQFSWNFTVLPPSIPPPSQNKVQTDLN